DRPPDIRHGTLICLPVVNTYGFENQSRYLPDRRDLNRSFPGFQEGSPSSRLAYYIFNEVVAKCDFGLDFHSAAVRRTNYPNIRADMKNPQVRALARAFGCELIVNSKGPSGSLRRTAVRKGIPTLILEAGEVWKFEPGVVEIGVIGSINLMRKMGMLEGEVQKPIFQVTIDKTTWVRASRGGFLGFHAKPGDFVSKDQELATNTSIFGRERNVITSPVNGIVLGMTTMPAVKPGEPIYHIAVMAEKTMTRIRKQMEKSSESTYYRRIQEALSTNITLLERQNHVETE
ncbi:MAG: succinylglutamate desuccinylase/aspartoacylase family protein, partial [Candidatus Omnitrophica bacterium]|nr:succinylglutamate desuccinylase/aspartoacylase family protein [Candidatus Omnitrophota bacterium]